jgi:hypothetical protein
LEKDRGIFDEINKIYRIKKKQRSCADKGVPKLLRRAVNLGTRRIQG